MHGIITVPTNRMTYRYQGGGVTEATLSEEVKFDDKELHQYYIDLKAGKRPDRVRVARWITNHKQPVTINDWSQIKDAILEAYGITEDDFTVMFKKPIITTKPKFVDDFLPLLKRNNINGWLGRYIDYTMGVEPPTAYHFATGLTVLGAALHRQVYFDQRFFKIYPAVQSFLVGPSGKTRKSTAGNIGIALAEECGRVKRLPDMATPEALLRELAGMSNKDGSASALMYSSELSTFLNKKDYNQDLVQVLTDLFDCRDSIVRSTISHSRQEIRNVAVSAILCSNEVWLASSVHESAFGGGMLGRTLVWHALGTDRYFPFPEEQPEALYKRLVGELGLTRYYHGAAEIEPAAKRWFTEKYRYTKENWPDDERLSPFWERYPIHLLRVGMLLNISDTLETDKRNVVITDQNLIQADAILTWIYQYLPRVYKYLGNTQWGDDMRRVYDNIYRHGGRSDWSTIYRALSKRMRKDDIRRVVDQLVDNGILRVEEASNLEGGKVYTIDTELD
jgi:hypothetical protein